MIKSPLILISYFGLFLMNFFAAEDVSIKNNLPAMVAPGTKSLVEMTIEKGAIQGFSKLELTVPNGFTITASEVKGASFTFSSQKAKFVWMTLPSEASFTISYYIESTPEMEGPFEIDGGFSYVKENKRMDISIPTKTLILKKGLEPTPEQVAQQMPELKREAEVIEMVCSRTVTKVTDTDFMVNLKVSNNNINGFGKILEILPDHCTTEKVNDGGAVITQDENTIKFVWFEVPVAESFEVSYKLSCTGVSDMPFIRGELSYTDNGNPVVTAIIQTNESGEVIATTPPANLPVVAETETKTETATPAETATTTENNKENPVAENTSASNTKRENPVTSIPSPETGITYKVQIMAAHKVVDKSYFRNRFNFTDKFNIENHEGWVKYTTGKFTEYKDARDARVRLTSDHGKLPGPFVTAYNDGERITVQEALLISKQQWYN